MPPRRYRSRVERRVAGVCHSCEREVVEGNRQCRECLDRAAAQQRPGRTKAARVWCDECLAYGTHLPDCKAQKARRAEEIRQLLES